MHALVLALACRSDPKQRQQGQLDSDPQQQDSPDDTSTPEHQDGDGDGYAVEDDCDDDDAQVNPGAQETPYNGVDDDCDEGTLDDDLDGDGFVRADDCDDQNPLKNPDAEEIWYDGVDQDCDGADDYDQDGDGDVALDHGGTDCDDQDADRYGGQGCRPETDAEFAGSETLNTDISGAFSDLVYASDGALYLCTLISGTDYVYVYEDTAHTSTLSGYSNWNMNAIALDTSSAGEVVVGYTSGASLGYESAGSLPVLAGGTAAAGGSYANSYMAASPNSLAVDSSGCIWATNFAGSGSLSCVLGDGSHTDYTIGASYLDAVGLDSSETVYVVDGDTIYSFEPASETLTSVYTADAEILDFVFDYNDELYLETTHDEVWKVAADGSASVLGAVSGDGRLAIHPAGSLVRMMADPVNASSFEAWTLE